MSDDNSFRVFVPHDHEPDPNAKAGKLVPPYGGVEHCANTDCLRTLSEKEGEGDGAYLFKNNTTGKICVLCGDCARYVELSHREQFTLIAL
jgi:hypothetical protein